MFPCSHVNYPAFFFFSFPYNLRNMKRIKANILKKKNKASKYKIKKSWDNGKKNLLNKIGKEIELNGFKKLKLPQKWAKRLDCHVKLKKRRNKKKINKTRHEIQRDDAALCCIKLKIYIYIKQLWKLEESCSWLLYEIKKRKKNWM